MCAAALDYDFNRNLNSDRDSPVAHELVWTPNIWMGVSVEHDKQRHRIDALREVGARVKFLSLEPLLGPLPDLDLSGIDWVIVGGESGPKARSIDPEWVTDLRDQCRCARVPFFFKQWGGKNKKKTGRVLDGRTWDQMPKVATGACARI
jgi:protein gp37